jgi:hypothetical protein
VAALFVDHLQKQYPDAFTNQARWNRRIPADLGEIVCEGLNATLPRSSTYVYDGFDTVVRALRADPMVAAFLRSV